MKTTAAAQQSGMKQEQFEKLFSDHSKMMYRAAYSVTGNKYDAQNVVQDVFLKLIDRGLTLESAANPAGYLFRMTINEALQLFRTRKRENETDDGLESLQDTPIEDNPFDADIRERLLDGIAQLEPWQAEVLVLWVDHGYSDAEIADMLGKTRGAVAATLHRAKERLKKLMSKEKEEKRS
jgi:RNA polymerase sigma-70 factor, ECF subfamily